MTRPTLRPAALCLHPALGALALWLALVLALPAQAQAQAQGPQDRPVAPAAEGRANVASAWEAAVAHVQAGEPRAAIPLLERLVTLLPDEASIRLELGLAYALIEDDEKARFHITRALSGDLGARERAGAERLLAGLEGRRRWSAAFGFAFVPQSNAGRRTSTQEVMIGGLPFRLNQTAASGTGLQLSARVSWTPRLADDLWGRAAFSAFGTVYDNNSLNDYTARAELGLERRYDRGRALGLGLLAARRWVGDARYTDDVGAYATASGRVGAGTRLSLRTEILTRSAPGRPGLEGQLYRLTLAGEHVVTPRVAVFGRAFATLTDVQSDRESGRQGGVTLGASYQFDGGWRGTLEGTVSRDHRDGAEAFFPVTRRDTELRLAARVMNRRLQLAGYAPVLEVGHERRRSRSPLHAFENTYVSVGLDRQF